jgi:hypothetical protein
LLARFRKPLVDAGDVFVEQAIEAADPGLTDVVSTKFSDETGRVFAEKFLVWPVAQVDMGVGDWL